MLLHSLIRQFNSEASISGVPNIEITGICEDSRQVQPGNVFIARSGAQANGAAFLADAAARGAAAAIVGSKVTP
ncbi:MAG TPA: Mur ligase domain-containing protein, partial [Tepidisphaeraceae bacterium]